MPWIESHQSLRDHPKLIALCAEMEWDTDVGIGKLNRFWWWCLDYAIDGDLRKFNDAQIAHGMGVAIPSAKKLTSAMVQSRWIDREPYFRVHDWWDYVGPFLKIKWRDYPQKWKPIQSAYQTHGEAHVVKQGANPSTDRPTDRSLPPAREAEPDPNVWPMKPEITVLPPVDPVWPARIATIHAWYGEQMGFKAAPDMQEERLWFDWFKAGFEEEQLKLVFRYLRAQTKEKKGRNPGALTLRNLLRPEQFKEDLRLAMAERKPMAEKKAKEIEAKPMSPAALAALGAELQRAREAIR